MAVAGALRLPGERTRPQLLAALVLLGALVVGAVLGVAFERVRGGAARAEASWLDDFAGELALTPAQRLAVDSILDERHRVIDSLVAPVRPQIDGARAAARRQIRTRLTAVQQARFDAYVARMERAEQTTAPPAHR